MEQERKILEFSECRTVRYCVQNKFSIKQILRATECPLKKRLQLAMGVIWRRYCKERWEKLVVVLKVSALVVLLILEGIFNLFFGVIALVLICLSLVWYPVMLWRWPVQAKSLLERPVVSEIEEGDDCWQDIYKMALYCPSWLFQKILSWMWSRLRKLFPVIRWEVSWFDRQGDNKLSLLKEKVLWKEVVKRLWERSPEDRKIISKSRVLHMKSLRELFYSDSEEDYNTLRDYVVSTKSSDLPKDLEPFLVSKITENGDDESIIHRAYGVLSSLEKLSSPTLAALVGMIESPKAVELLNSYWKDKGKTFSQEIVDLIVEKIDTKEGYNLFFNIASRDALSSKTVDRFLDICEENGFTDKKEAFLSMRKRRADCYEQSYTASGCHETLVKDKAQWQQYLAMVDSVVPAAQAEMTEWQYDLFHERGFLLDEKVVYTMLIERSLHNKYFRKVLSEAIGRGIFSVRARMHVMDSDWKRDILYELEHASKDQPF